MFLEDLGNVLAMSHETFCDRLFTKSVADVNKAQIIRAFNKVPAVKVNKLGRIQSKNLHQIILDEMLRPAWSVYSVADRLEREYLILTDKDVMRIARTETQVIANKAREIEYRQRYGANSLYIWNGPDDERTSDMCRTIKNAQPANGLPLDQLKYLVYRVSHQFGNTLRRDWSTHPYCRHYLKRAWEYDIYGFSITS